MVVLVLMLDSMRVSRAVVCVRKDVLMYVIVLLCQCINNHDNRSQNHNYKTEEIRPSRFFLKN